jgi:heat shock protein HslJ
MALAGTWRLVELDGVRLPEGGDDGRPELTFDPEAMRISGSGGCNRLMASFEATHVELSFGPVATTLMACSEEIMERERGFLRALESTTGFELAGRELWLLAGDAVLARLDERSGPDEP